MKSLIETIENFCEHMFLVSNLEEILAFFQFPQFSYIGKDFLNGLKMELSTAQ